MPKVCRNHPDRSRHNVLEKNRRRADRGTGYKVPPKIFITSTRDAFMESAGYMGVTKDSVNTTSFRVSFGEYNVPTGQYGFTWIAIGF